MTCRYSGYTDHRALGEVLFRRRDNPIAELLPQDMPRDVEAVEAVIDALDAGVVDDVEAHRIITGTLVSELGLDYGAVWSTLR